MNSWPQTFDTSTAPSEMVALIAQLMDLLLAGEAPPAAILRDQYVRARLAKLTLTGPGFFANFEVPTDTARVDPPRLVGGAAEIDIQGVEHSAGCVLFVDEGVIQTLEGYTYGDEWPMHPRVNAIRNVVPIVA
jgi:hypothetical protein